MTHKQFWMSNVLAAVCLAFALWFPSDSSLQSFVAGVAFLVALPLLFARIFLRKRAEDFGVSWGNTTQGLLWLALGVAVVIVVLIGASRFLDLSEWVSVPLAVRRNFLSFLIYISIMGVFFATQEFFLRGFVLHVWKERFGVRAIGVQTTLAFLWTLLSSSGRASSSILVSVALSFYAGWIAYRSHSIWYSFFFFFISAILGISTVLIFVR